MDPAEWFEVDRWSHGTDRSAGAVGWFFAGACAALAIVAAFYPAGPPSGIVRFASAAVFVFLGSAAVVLNPSIGGRRPQLGRLGVSDRGFSIESAEAPRAEYLWADPRLEVSIADSGHDWTGHRRTEDLFDHEIHIRVSHPGSPLEFKANWTAAACLLATAAELGVPVSRDRVVSSELGSYIRNDIGRTVAPAERMSSRQAKMLFGSQAPELLPIPDRSGRWMPLEPLPADPRPLGAQ